MNRIFLFLLAAAMLQPLSADSYHDALLNYLQNSDVTSTEQFEEKLSPIVQQAIPDNPDEVRILLKRYISTRLMTDLASIFEPAFRKHVSEEELQQLAAIYSSPRLTAIQTKLATNLSNFDKSTEFANLTNSMGAALQTIMSGGKPQPFTSNAGIPEEYVTKFNHYYKASKTGEMIDNTFAGMTGMITTQLRSNNVANAEQITTQLMNYLSASMPAIMCRLFHRNMTESDLQMLIDASCSPAYQHTVDAVSEIVSNPLMLSAQLATKMGEWIDTNARRHSKKFQPVVQALNAAADPCVGEVHKTVDKLPEFPGGTTEMYQFINEHVVIPFELKQTGFEGKGVYSMVVNKDGSITDFEVIRSTGNETLDLQTGQACASMPHWIPGVLEGEIVRTQITMPVNFRLEYESDETKGASKANKKKK